MTASEQRTVRYGIIVVAAAAIFLLGSRGWTALQARSAAYNQLLDKSAALQSQLKPYGDLVAVDKKMMEHYQIDPAKLSHATVVGEASKQIQETAAGCGVGVGSIRESAAKNAAKEMATLQFEGSGQVAGVLGLLKRLETIGYPVIIDSVQITPQPMPPGQVKISLSLVVLDYEQWKKESKSHA